MTAIRADRPSPSELPSTTRRTDGVSCPACATVMLADAKFCSECGRRLSAASADPPAAPPARVGAMTERRQLTVMFCDLVGSTLLSTRMDPEDLRDVIGAYQRCITDQVGLLGGFVAKYMGDGVLACFGYPEAHEDDAERAIQAGLAAIQTVSRLRSAPATQLQLRIGIATGPMVVGDIMGTGQAHHDVAGETAHLAARLQSLAEPDTLLIAAGTRKLVGNAFALRGLGQLNLRGFAGQVEAWEVLHMNTAAANRFEVNAASDPRRLVGRRKEMALLQDCWLRAQGEAGQVVLLSGDAGIGKSGLAAMLQERVQGQGHVRLAYYCTPHHEDSPFHPFLAELGRAAGFAPNDDPAQRVAKLATLAAPGPWQEEDAAMLANLLLLQAPSPKLATGDEPKPQLTPTRRREKSMAALLRRLEHLASCQPVLMVLEDAHWIDRTSAEFLELLIGQIARLRVLVLITCRPEFKAPWARSAPVTHLSLSPLDRTDSAALVLEIAQGASLSAALAADIVARTDGIPLFIEELTKAVIEEGASVVYTSGATLDALSVPSKLQSFLLARLDRLGPAREVAQIGSALGREFSHDLLAAVAGETEADLEAFLLRLIDAGLISRSGGPTQPSYLFKHSLIQDAAYDTMLRQTRRDLHKRIAQVLEHAFPDTVQTQPALLARHCIAAGLAASAVPYCLAAGKQALARSAMPEAISHLRKGLTVLDTLPESGSRNRHELELRAVLGKALVATEGSAAPVTGDMFARAYQLVQRLESPAHLVSVVHGQWSHALLRTELSSARRYAEELLELGAARGDSVMAMMGHRFSGTTFFALGTFDAACDHLRRGVLLFDPMRRAEYAALLVDDSRVIMRAYLTWSLLMAGRLDEAQRQADAAMGEARVLRQPYILAHGLIGRTYADVLVDSPHTALETLVQLMPLVHENGIAYYIAVAMIWRGWCRAVTGDTQGGLDELRAGLDSYRATGSTLYVPSFLGLLADALGQAGRAEEGLQHLAEAAELLHATGALTHASDTMRLQGKLLGAGNTASRDAAAERFRLAIGAARRQGVKLSELRAAMDFVELRGSDDPEARGFLASIHGWFRQGSGAALLQKASAMLQGG